MIYVKEATLTYFRTVLTRTQYKYWYSYYVEEKTLAQISIENDVHITTVCRVMKNARKRLNEAYQDNESFRKKVL